MSKESCYLKQLVKEEQIKTTSRGQKYDHQSIKLKKIKEKFNEKHLILRKKSMKPIKL